jgi:uncharacterized protein YndB with AHSA1/START domain
MSFSVETNQHIITIAKTFDASVNSVWEAWTNPLQIAKWWAPHGIPVTIVSHDLKEGGEWKYILHMEDKTEFVSQGVFKNINPPYSLDKTAIFGERMKEVIVQVRFE